MLKLYGIIQRSSNSIKREFSNRKEFNQIELQSMIIQDNLLKDEIRKIIQFNQGEIKFSKYWEYCLTHPEHGYYSKKSAFSKEGDFTTSPEISSVFGQMFGVWIFYFLEKITHDQNRRRIGQGKQPIQFLKRYRLLELGPGRGLFMKDIIRTLKSLKAIPVLDSITMIETSPLNTQTQQQAILDELKNADIHFQYSYELRDKQIFKGENNNMELKWFKSIQDMQSYQIKEENKQQKPITIILAHQFFDALPTTPLVYTADGWREKVIKLSANNDLVLQPSEKNLMDKLIPKVDNPNIGDIIEISYESLLMMESLSQIVAKCNGAIINIDYGNQFIHSDSIRAIKDHKFVPYPFWLQIPGNCDLSAYVDFSALANFAEKVPGIKSLGVVEQGYFLQAMGINARLQILMKNATKQKIARMESEYHRLTHPDEMGQIYKVQIITKNDNGEIFPFISQTNERQLQYFDVWRSTSGMPTDAINLIKSIQKNQEHKFTGKQVAQILKDVKVEKQIKKYNEANIKQQMKQELKEMQKTQKMIREMYSVWYVPQLSLKIKQNLLMKMNNRLKDLTEKPTDLELKFKNDISRRECGFNVGFNYGDIDYWWYDDLKQFAQSLKNPNLKSLKTLTLYMPYCLGFDSDTINREQLISSSLLSLPELQSVTIIAYDIKSLDGFKSLGNKLNASKDEGWFNRQEWQQ